MEVEVIDVKDAGAIGRCGSVSASESNWSIQSSLDGAKIHEGEIHNKEATINVHVGGNTVH